MWLDEILILVFLIVNFIVYKIELGVFVWVYFVWFGIG